MILAWQANAQVLEDPTRPANSQSLVSTEKRQSNQTLHLDAVMQLGATRTAIVNGQAVKVGQTIQGAVIKEIHPRSVVISQAENGVWKTLTLQVSQRENVKTNAAENY